MEPTENPWKLLNSQPVFDNPWIKVFDEQVINPRGGQSQYGRVSFKNKAIAIIPLDEQLNTWIVGQHRYTLKEYSWEIPMGGGDKDTDLLLSAKRELQEETGLSARRWTNIMRLHTSNSVTDEEGFVFLAQELTEGDTAFDETEDLRIRKLPLQEAVKMVMDGKITDAISVAGLLKAARLFNL